MFIDTHGPTMTYEGLPIGVDTYIRNADMIPDHTQEICIRANAVRDHKNEIRYWLITMTFNASGVMIKQSAAVEFVDPPAWMIGLL